MRKLLIIGGAAVVLVVTGAGALFFLGFSQEAVAPPSPAPQPTPRPALRAAQKVLALSESRVVPALYPRRDGSLLFYTAAGAWELRPPAETPEALSKTELPGLERVVWSPSGQRVVTIRQQDSARSVSLYDYASQSTRPLSQFFEAGAFSPDGGEIAFQERNPNIGTNNILITTVGGENQNVLLKTRTGLWHIFWQERDRLLVVPQPSGLSQGTLFALDREGKLEKLMTANGLIVRPSPSGRLVLVSRTDTSGKNLSLSVLDLRTRQERNLTREFGLRALAEKCAWFPDDRTVLCAAFRTLPPEAVMPDDYYKGTLRPNEVPVMLNLETNERTEIELGGTFDITSPAVNATQEWFYFINRADGLPYGVRLPENQ